jgi:hypothetical protein
MNYVRAAAYAIFALNVSFVAAAASAAGLYPGGTWLRPDSVGHSFWENFLCDLLHTQSLNGGNNATGATLARGGMLAEAVALLLVWLSAPCLFPRRARTATFIRLAGVLSTLGTLAVVLLPSDRFGHVHGFAVVLASLPAFLAAVVCIVALLRSPAGRGSGLAGAAALATSFVSFGLYARTQFFGETLTLWVPASQRVATLAVVSFCCAVAWQLRNAQREVGEPAG